MVLSSPWKILQGFGWALALTQEPTSPRVFSKADGTSSFPTPPFPDGSVCQGKLVTIPAEDTYGIDVRLAGNPLLLPPRPMQVWLPPTYENSSQRHQVLYVHDGQNAITDSSSWTGYSWRLAGALTRLMDHGKIRNIPICVLLHSASGDLVPGVVRRRHLEYGELNNAFARAHCDLVAQTIKPLVDATFRTYTSPRDNFAMGTSMGGQASLNLLLAHGDKFGGAACLSPYFGPHTMEQVSTQPMSLKDKVIYMDIGGDMEETKVPLFDLFDHWTETNWLNPGYFWLDTQLQPAVKEMKTILATNRIDHKFMEFPGARHNERAWSQRIDKPLLHLFGDR